MQFVEMVLSLLSNAPNEIYMMNSDAKRFDFELYMYMYAFSVAVVDSIHSNTFDTEGAMLYWGNLTSRPRLVSLFVLSKQ